MEMDRTAGTDPEGRTERDGRRWHRDRIRSDPNRTDRIEIERRRIWRQSRRIDHTQAELYG